MANGTEAKGARITLCPFEGDFWTLGLDWYNDPEIVAMTSDDQSLLNEQEFRLTMEGDLVAKHSIVFGILDEDRLPIGIGILRNVDPVHRGCELHITIGERRCWDRGYGADAISTMRDYAFHKRNCHKVISTPFAKNPRMIRCLEKCGFEQEGVLRDALLQGDSFIDVVLMGVINPLEASTRLE